MNNSDSEFDNDTFNEEFIPEEIGLSNENVDPFILKVSSYQYKIFDKLIDKYYILLQNIMNINFDENDNSDSQINLNIQNFYCLIDRLNIINRNIELIENDITHLNDLLQMGNLKQNKDELSLKIKNLKKDDDLINKIAPFIYLFSLF